MSRSENFQGVHFKNSLNQQSLDDFKKICRPFELSMIFLLGCLDFDCFYSTKTHISIILSNIILQICQLIDICSLIYQTLPPSTFPHYLFLSPSDRATLVTLNCGRKKRDAARYNIRCKSINMCI